MYDPAINAAEFNSILADLEHEYSKRRAHRVWTILLIALIGGGILVFRNAIPSHLPLFLVLVIITAFGVVLDQINQLQIDRTGDRIDQLTYMSELRHDMKLATQAPAYNMNDRRNPDDNIRRPIETRKLYVVN